MLAERTQKNTRKRLVSVVWAGLDLPSATWEPIGSMRERERERERERALLGTMHASPSNSGSSNIIGITTDLNCLTNSRKGGSLSVDHNGIPYCTHRRDSDRGKTRSAYWRCATQCVCLFIVLMYRPPLTP
jgi:hypothetical protein